MPQLKHETLTQLQSESAQPQAIHPLRAQVKDARLRQSQRQGCTNSWLGAKHLQQEMALAGLDQGFLTRALEQFQLSARSYHKVWRIARTIADIDGQDKISQSHMIEALGFRSLPWEQGLK